MGDMTTENVDAIVNAANEKLDHVSGLAGSIVKKGGEIIQVESDNLIWERRSMPLEEGDVAVTTAGRLPAKHVIHAVGPVWHGGKNGEEVILHLAVSNVLSKAEEMKLASVSIPAISSGIFGFPKPLCCQIVIGTPAFGITSSIAAWNHLPY
jgi:putative ATPase